MENTQGTTPDPNEEKARVTRVARIGKMKKALKQAKAKSPAAATVKSRLEKDHDSAKAFEQYPLQVNLDPKLSKQEQIEQFERNVISAETRKQVSNVMFEHDKKLPKEEQEAIIDQQIKRFYDFNVGQKDLRGHVESPHGTQPSEKIHQWCEERKISDYEFHTNDITKQTTNWMVFNKPRILTDVNSLDKGTESSLRAEHAVYTKEDNQTALKAQRDLTAKMLKEQGNLDKDGKVINPHLAIYLHGKTDSRGHDFEIAAKQEDGKGPLNPLLAFWIAQKLGEKVKAKGLKNSKGEEPSVNVVASKGAYSGSYSLTALRNGDDVFGFKGFGENFQALQLECGAHMREKHGKELAGILNELMADFTAEFKTTKDFEKLKSYETTYTEKQKQEKESIFDPKKVGFSKEIPEDKIALGKTLREELGVDRGDKVKIGEHVFEVMQMKNADLKKGVNSMLNEKFEGKLGENFKIEKVGGTVEEKKPATGAATTPENEKKDGAGHEENHTAATPPPAPSELKIKGGKLFKKIRGLFRTGWDKFKGIFGFGGHDSHGH